MWLYALTVVLMMSLPMTSQGAPITCKGLAKYNVTFEAMWSREDFPKQYPLFRPHAQWTKVLGRSHADEYSLYELGEPASIALKQFAETGVSTILDDETQGKVGVLDMFALPALNRGIGSTTSKFFVDENHPKVTLMSRIVPSPDWLVGISGLDLCEGGEWRSKLFLELAPIDAGTDQGFTFTAPNWPVEQEQPVSIITSQKPNHPANSFYYPERESLPPIGSFEIHRMVTYVWESGIDYQDDVMSDDDDVSGEENENGPVDCEVSEWQEWSSCSKTCGFGTHSRSRTVLRQSARSGTPCPLLQDEQLCGSMRSCGWKHFSFGGGPKGKRFRFGNWQRRSTQ